MSQDASSPRPIRCAIYTRKSAQPPITQDITSLESQRSICASYIASQQHRNWAEIGKHYDDAGKSGATLERPALAALMDDIEQGQIDVVLVYKMDRITRTLLDFVRLLDMFERFGVELVAITQNFDTSDSMGRLIRNILLTFAQFEREIAGDRMRDKKMVMKQRGRWTGGNPPFGYHLKRGKLVINPDEAPAVACLYETYLATASMAAAHKRMNAMGYRRKAVRRRDGRVGPTRPVGLPSLYHMLQNPVYIGDVTYRGERYKGIHEPILDSALWNQVQDLLATRKPHVPAGINHLLTGLIFDSHGRKMNAYRKDPGTRYYESAFAKWAIEQRIKTCRVRADAAEDIVMAALQRFFRDRANLRVYLMRAGLAAHHADRIAGLGAPAAVRLMKLKPADLRLAVQQLITRVEIAHDCVRLLIRVNVAARFLEWTGIGPFRIDDLELARTHAVHMLELPTSLITLRSKPFMPIAPRSDMQSEPTPGLVRLLNEARQAQQLIFAHRDMTFSQIARLSRFRPATLGRLARLNYLAPDIVAAILDGTQPPSLTRAKLIKTDLPTDWGLQRTLLGFPEQAELNA